MHHQGAALMPTHTHAVDLPLYPETTLHHLLAVRNEPNSRGNTFLLFSSQLTDEEGGGFRLLWFFVLQGFFFEAIHLSNLLPEERNRVSSTCCLPITVTHILLHKPCSNFCFLGANLK